MTLAATEDVRICAVCGEEIYHNGKRWAGVYILTDGDVCIDRKNETVHPDHTPSDEQVVEASTTKVVARSGDRELLAKSVALGIVNVFD